MDKQATVADNNEGARSRETEDIDFDYLSQDHEMTTGEQPAVINDVINEENTSSINDAENDIISAVLKAFYMIKDMGGSQKNLMEMITFGRDFYSKQNDEVKNIWLKYHSACLQVLRKAGYEDPIKYYVCLNENHPTHWSSLLDQNDKCQCCNQPGSIPYYYLSLTDKIQRWCANIEFCVNMTAQWGKQQHLK